MDISTDIDENAIFNLAVEFVFILEGWKTTDTGGKTVWGISEKAHPAEVAKMWNLDLEKSKTIAKEIYRKQYWEPLRQFLVKNKHFGPFTQKELEDLRIIAFDTAVNCGLAKTETWIEEINRHHCSLALKIEWLLWKRVYHYLDIVSKDKKYRKYFYGWINRVKKVREFCYVFEKK